MSNNSKKPILLGWFVFLIVTSVVLFGFYKIRHMGGQRETVAPPPPKVVAMKPVKQEVSQIFEEIGQIEAINKADVTARVEGELQKREFIEGSYIEKDDILFLIEKDTYEAALDKALASFKDASSAYDEATRQVERLEKTVKEGVSQAEMDAAINARNKAEAAKDTAKAAIRIAKLNLDYTTIKAPISGKIGKANMTEGNIVSPASGTLATIVQMNPIYAVFAIGEDKALSINNSGRSKDFSDIDVSLTLSNGQEFEHKGKIVFMDNVVNDESGSVLMRATFPNPEEVIIPGQFVNIKLIPQTKVEKYLIPEAALIHDQSGDFVLKIDENNIVRRNMVTLGRKIGLYKIAESGISGDEKIIYKGIEKAREGAPVTPEIKSIEEETKNSEVK